MKRSKNDLHFLNAVSAALTTVVLCILIAVMIAQHRKTAECNDTCQINQALEAINALGVGGTIELPSGTLYRIPPLKSPDKFSGVADSGEYHFGCSQQDSGDAE